MQNLGKAFKYILEVVDKIWDIYTRVLIFPIKKYKKKIRICQRMGKFYSLFTSS